MFQDKRGPLWNPSPLDWISNCTHKVSLVKCLLILFSSHLHSTPATYCIILPYGCKKYPKANNNKKARTECHRCPHASFPVLFCVKFLPASLIIFLKTPWQLFPSQPSCSPQVLPMGHTSYLTRSWRWQVHWWPRLGCCQQAPGEGKVLMNVVETTPLSSKEPGVKLAETQIKCAYCFKQSQHRADLSFVPGSNVKLMRKQTNKPKQIKTNPTL